MKSVVILSARGFLGSTLLEHLRARGDTNLIALDSENCNLLDPISTQEAISRLPDKFTLVYLSAFGRVPRDDFHVYQRNETMIRHLVAGLKHKLLSNLIYVSSACVYGRPPSETPLHETSPVQPQDHYGLSKYVGERLLQLNLASTPTILRIPGTYGKRDASVSVVARFIAAISRQQPVVLENGGQQKRDFLFAGDFARVVEHCVDHPFPGVVNLSSGDPMSLVSLVHLIGDLMRVRPQIEFREALRPTFDLIFDRSRLREWAPQLQFTTLAEGIRSVIS